MLAAAGRRDAAMLAETSGPRGRRALTQGVRADSEDARRRRVRRLPELLEYPVDFLLLAAATCLAGSAITDAAAVGGLVIPQESA